MDDYRIAIGWVDHPKRVKLERRLGRDAVLALMDLWGWCARTPSRRSGSLAAMDVDDIAIAARYSGNPEEFVQQLVDLRLLDVDCDGYRIHDYASINPYVASSNQRSKAASIAAKIRWHKLGRHKGTMVEGCPLCEVDAEEQTYMPDDANAMRRNANASIRYAPYPSPSPDPDPDPSPDPIAPSCSQDEHSTHDVKENRIAEASLATSTPEIVSPAVLGIPLVNGAEHKITQADVADWSRDFPAVDVMQELRKLRQWNISRPKNRKTARGIRAHITSWLSKAQDRGGAMPPPALRRFTSRQEESMAAALAATEVHNDRIEEIERERESTNVVRATGGGPIRALPERIDAVDDDSHVVESPTRLVRARSHHGARESTSS
jgi:hypothetical protein